tara:strand:+ start:1028 stop:1228 length:201 start_codon:yes stop_codon:yes gene_type:complete
MIDKEILIKLTLLEKLLETLLLKQDQISAQISDDISVSAVQAERALEVEKMKEMARKAIEKAASFN